MSIAGNIPSDNLDLAGVELHTKLSKRYYCGSQFKDKDEMSKHINRIHIGSGLLE